MNRKPPSRRLPSAKPKAGQVDAVVGTRLRLRRRMLAMTQRDLADALDIAQQQLQKYETGQNRISASRLYEAARILKAPVAWFYEGLDDPEAEEGLQIVLGMADGETLLRLSQGEIESLLRAYANDPDRRQRLLQILNMLVVPPRP